MSVKFTTDPWSPSMSTKSPSRDSPTTLDDVVRRVALMEDLTDQRRRDLASAVRRFADLQNRQLADIPADIEALRRQIALIIPAAVGMTIRRWSNLRSLLVTALKLTGASVIRRRTTPLSPAWR